jgi:peptidoglycan/LPS O-acetylase OafA/YrhL
MEQVSRRVAKLDSVRGIAALMVVIGHCGGFSFFGLADSPSFRWLAILWDGESAVVMFFLLSGYVLSLQLGSPAPPNFWQYLVRRVLRIWPAFAVTVVLAWLVFVTLGIPVDAGHHHGAPRIPGWHDLVSNLLMIGNEYAIDPPVWSLYVEMRLSVVFPLFFLLTKRVSAIWALLLSLMLSIVLSRAVHWPLPEFVLSLASTSRYIVLFVVGAVLAQAGNPVEKAFVGMGAILRYALLALALTCLLYRFVEINGQMLPLAGYIRWLGTTLLFLFCLYWKPMEPVLNKKMLLFLGRVSYGVYLTHFPILLCAKRLVSGSLLTSLVVVSSILAGWGLNKWVEQPMIGVGRRLSSSAKNTNSRLSNHS